ncbi:MAG: hypothetical protein LBU08_04245 [Tannerellaceae bacterium]|jgi:hypothetical protein|nr:hypothetical protein [Tannerellaceae bacterium]
MRKGIVSGRERRWVSRKAGLGYLSGLVGDWSKGTYNILILGGLGAYFLKRDEVELSEIVMMVGLGAVIAGIFGYVGYKLKLKEHKDD